MDANISLELVFDNVPWSFVRNSTKLKHAGTYGNPWAPDEDLKELYVLRVRVRVRVRVRCDVIWACVRVRISVRVRDDHRGILSMRTSAEAAGYRIERALMDCRRGGRRNPSVPSSRILVAKGVCLA